MKNNGNSDSSITFVRKSLTYLSKHTNLNQPEQVKHHIANKTVSNGYKKNLCLAYDKYCEYNGIEWQMPIYKPEAKTIKIPTKAKIEMLIARAGKTLGLKLQISKDTGLRPVELCNLKVKDIDLDKKLIHPTTAKHGAPRQLKITNSLKARIEIHIDTNKLGLNDKVFLGNAENYGKYYRQMRNSLADKLHDQTLKTIRLYDFRHYYATMLYAKTRDILYVKQQMGHKKIETTLIYTQLLNLNDDEWTCKTATNITEATNLIEAGFQYIAEKDETMLFRKRK